jgi:NAD(P)-dependent dehydrogenase (short-subunit alcohol dehydrogenase family)
VSGLCEDGPWPARDRWARWAWVDGLGQNWNEADLQGVQGRFCEPEEVAAAALWLASDEASFINGLALYVDNGWYAKG